MVCWHNQGLNTGRPARCVYVNTGGGRRSCPGPDRVGVLATGSHEVAASIWNQVMERHLELDTHRKGSCAKWGSLFYSVDKV